MSEIWKAIPGYEGFYEVSDHGRIRSLAVGRNRKTGQVLNPAADTKGYRHLSLSMNGVVKFHKVHRLVLAAFRGPSDLDGLHGDGNPDNNSLSNLRWGTVQENSADRVRHGTGRNKNTGKEACIRGHALSGENLYVYVRDGKGGRHCKKCQILRQRARRRGVPLEVVLSESEVES